MAEQSHLEAMREAIKGDLERARSRNPSIFERPATPAVEIREQPAPQPTPVEAGPVAVAPEPIAVEPAPEHEAAPEAAPVETEPRRSFFSRLAFWR